MSASPAVSVIVPFDRPGDGLNAAIGSLVAQTLADIEILAVAFGSSITAARGGGFGHDPRIVFLDGSGGGRAAAMNHGLRHARGRYVALLGADDIAEPWRFAHQVELLEQRCADAAFSPPALIDGEGLILHDSLLPAFFQGGEAGSPDDMLRRLILNGDILCASTAMMRGDAVREVGLLREDLEEMQAYDLWLRLAAAGKRLVAMQRRVTRHRLDPHDPGRRRRQEVALGEQVTCLLRALQDAPGDALARAFPDLMPPGSSTATELDRAMIALSHPLAFEMGCASILRMFIAAGQQTLTPLRFAELCTRPRWGIRLPQLPADAADFSEARRAEPLRAAPRS